MDYSDNIIFEKLIADSQFIRWAKRKEVEDAEKWENWKTLHPEYSKEFDNAVKLIRSFSFSPPQISDHDVKYLWQQTRSMFVDKKQPSKVRKLITILTKVAAVLFIPLLVYTSWSYFSKDEISFKYAQLIESAETREVTVTAPVGARTLVDLPDGSRVWLNSGSELTYPAIFSENERKVKIAGEAYFKVQKDELPFVVENFGPPIKVYGTEFNVNSYNDEDRVTVALVEGKISLLHHGKELFLAPGQVSYFNKTKDEIVTKKEDIERFVCWREGKLILRDASLNSILRILQRQYNVLVEIDNPQLGEYKYNATFQDEGLEQILELLELSAPIKYRYEKQRLLSNGTYSKPKVIITKDKKRIIKR